MSTARRKEDVLPIIRANIARETHVMTDEANTYRRNSARSLPRIAPLTTGAANTAIRTVRASRSARIRLRASTAMFKRGMKGTYQHCKEKHLHRYVAEFDFRYSNRSAVGVEDMERADKLAAGIVGKRLTYRRTNDTQA